MTYSIKTKDGIVINNIPDNIAQDDPILKQRVDAIRSQKQQQIDYSIPTDETFKPQVTQPETPRTMTERLKGVGETAATVATGIPAYLGGTIKGVGTEFLTGDFGKGTAERIAEETAAKYTYQPRTEAGREYTKELGEFMRETGLEGVGPNIIPTRVIPSVTGRTLAKVKPRAKDIPTIEGLKAESTNLYNQAKQAGVVFKPNKFNSNMKAIGSELRAEGYTETGFPRLASALKEAQEGKLPRDFTELQALRNMFNTAKASTDPAERRLASMALDKFDEYIMKAPTEDIKIGDQKGITAWQDARDTYRRLKKSEVFEEMMQTAQLDKTRLTQSGYENALAQQLRNLAKNKNKMRLFTPDEQQAIIQASKGNFGQNTLRFLGRFAPTGVLTGVGTGVLSTMQPTIGIPLAAGTLLSRYGATKLRERGIQNLSEMMRQPQSGFGVRLNEALPTGSQYYVPTGLLAEQLKEE